MNENIQKLDPKLFRHHSTRTIIRIKYLNDESPKELHNNKLYFVVYHGAFTDSGNNYQPKISVLIKEVNIQTGEIIGSGKCIKILSEYAELMQIGFVVKFEDNGCTARVKYKYLYPRQEFQIDYRKKGWESFYPKNEDEFFIPKALHDPTSSFDSLVIGAPYVKFHAQNHSQIRYLYVSCFELFMRTYGTSSYLKRVLLSYDLESAKSKLFQNFEYNKHSTKVGEWILKPNKNTSNGDIPLLAAIKYDETSKRIVKSIFSKLITKQKYKFPWISPWQQIKGSINVSGIKISDDAFLATRIEGTTVPENQVRIIKDKKVYIKNGIEIGENEASNLPPKELLNDPDFNLSQDKEPGDSGGITEIEGTKIETKGFPTINTSYDIEIVEIEDDSNKQNKKTSLDQYSKKQESDLTTNPQHNFPSNAKQANLIAPLELESKGTPYEIWSHFTRLKKAHPEIIQSVEHYNFQDGFSNLEPLSLITLPLPEKPKNYKNFDDDEKEKFTDAVNWTRIKRDRSRGLLVIKVVTNSCTFYCLEIERKIKTDNSGESENFKGCYFSLNNNKQLNAFLLNLLNSLPLVTGKFGSLTITNDISDYDTYIHKKYFNRPYLYDYAMRKIFTTMEVDIEIPIDVKKDV